MSIRLIVGDCRERLADLPDESVHCVVTSPPYFGLRDYGVGGQIGLEPTPDAYVAELVAVFREVRRVLRRDGTCWLNLGDSYAGNKAGNTNGTGTSGLKRDGRPEASRAATVAKMGADMASMSFQKSVPDGLKPKDLIGVPWRVAFALQADGWWLRSDIIWSKPNPMPESVRDRPTKAHEYVFMLTKSERYFYDADAIAEPTVSLDPDHPSYRPNSVAIAENGRKEYSAKHAMSARSYNPAGRNARTVWTIATQPYAEAHFATFPPELAERCIKAGSPKGGVVLDPFAGAGTTLLVADRLGRDAIGVELNPTYASLAERRVVADAPLFAEFSA